ncbi:hypothetical protein [Pseudomonas chlororaphis]|uniref:hypothetical protein n=1 Tax=Pseudomonas chlororaphis TaxID=587753 RepID=UPI0023665FFF|nr:hypothetical protein [Pseudomonas chlororaphis]WDH24988.1 hypothetical protein PUP50_12170 [Pseudomonas chlororaphis]
MSNNEMVSVPRELVDAAAEWLEHLSEKSSAERSVAEDLRDLLAQPAKPGYPSEDELIANGLGYPLGKEDAVKLHYAGLSSPVITILEAWDAIGHDIGCNPSKDELLDSLRNMAAICDAHGNDMPAAEPVPPAGGEPEVWGAFYFGGKRHGELRSHRETEAEIDAYIQNTERSEDSISLQKGRLYRQTPAQMPLTALVLPQRKEFGRSKSLDIEATGWNECLDICRPAIIRLQSEVERLTEDLRTRTADLLACGTTRKALQGEPDALKAAQGEPVAPFYISNADFNRLVSDDTAIASVRIGREKRGPFTEPLYAAPPAPVAVVLPERMYSLLPGADYWNACLDEVARLNPGAKP